MNPPTPQTQTQLECPNCANKGCSSCNDTGHFIIDSCPQRMLARDAGDRASASEVARLARFAEKGAWPVAGGVLDQSQVFLDACELYWSDCAGWRAARSPVPGG